MGHIYQKPRQISQLKGDWCRLHPNLNDFKEKQKNILDVVGQELQLKQDEYDSGVYADNTKQPQWNMWIDKELQLTGKYSNKEIEINLK